jgi:hypothetical protein
MILQRFRHQDNNIVKFCVVNQEEDVLREVILLHDWSIFVYNCNANRHAILGESQPALKFRVNRPRPRSQPAPRRESTRSGRRRMEDFKKR